MFIKYAFLVDSASVDMAGKLIAMGIFDIIYARKFPSVHRDMTLVMVVEGNVSEKGEHKLSIELRDEDGNNLYVFAPPFSLMPVKSSKNILNGRLMFKLQNVTFPRAGQYEFVSFVDDRFLGRIPLTVQGIKVEEAGEK